MRVHFADETGGGRALHDKLTTLGEEFAMDWHLHDASYKPRILLMVSKTGHCLNDLLFRYSSGLIHAQIQAVVSNHEDFRALTETHGIPFRYMPVSSENRAEQEAQLLQLIADERIDLVVLARYMQVLSDDACARLAGRAINIHHSFLPAFSGARPYQQAFERGVKIIGATAHIVTDDLDTGPIIAQDVRPVTHAHTAADMARAGRDVEKIVLAHGLTLLLEERVFLSGDRAVVFE
jgi:formyltetrahydrofolate deformylase